MTRTSVFSVAGAPSIGSCCVKLEYGCTVCQIASFTRPSITGPSADASSLPAVIVGTCCEDWANTGCGTPDDSRQSARRQHAHDERIEVPFMVVFRRESAGSVLHEVAA